MNWHVKPLKVSELKEWRKNPRDLTKKGLSDLKKSIQKFGIAEPLVVNTDGTICGGHGRLKVIQELGIDEVDCYLPEKELTPKEFEELNIRLNANIAGEWNMDMLANEWDKDELEEWGLDIGKDIDFDSIKANNDRNSNDKKQEIECPNCGEKFNI